MQHTIFLVFKVVNLHLWPSINIEKKHILQTCMFSPLYQIVGHFYTEFTLYTQNKFHQVQLQTWSKWRLGLH